MAQSDISPPSIFSRNIFEGARRCAAAFVSPPPVPLRILAAVDRYEADSEKIIGWIQLSGVLLFAALYAASYGAFEVHGALEPAPFALTFYGLFTLWRLRRAYGAGLSTAMQYASAGLDVAVFTAMIWSFPFQYDEPAALYLKAPTLLYVFILIGLRALRFSPGQVAFTGAAAAAGWAALAIYAALDGAAVTSDYRIYMTSLAFLPGAELEKIAAIAAFTGVLALGVARARDLLMRTATEQTAAADLAKFVGQDAAARIRASDEGVRAGDGELRFAAIMFIDLRGFTPATKDMAPADVIALLQDYQSRFVPVIEAGGGSVDKFLGDGILVSFGAARATGRECADALRTAMAVDAAATEWCAARSAAGLAPLDIGVSIAAGPVVYGAVGHADRLEYTVIGDAVNLAAKLEKHAKVAKARVIAASDVAARAAAQGFAPEAPRMLAGARVDGAPGPVDLTVLA